MIITNRVVAEGDCLVWCKSRNYAGYGQIRIKGRLWLAHRAVWVEANGPIPDGLFVLHTCDNPPCVNIAHLWLGTNADNQRDMARKGRHAMQRRTHCPAGHEYDEANTYVWRGVRSCRACRSATEKRRVRVRRKRQDVGSAP